MTKEEILKRVKKFQGANREFSQELPPIIEGLVDLIDEAGPEVVDNLTSNSPTKALSANMGKELKLMVDGKVSEPETAGTAGQILQLDEEGVPEWVDAAEVGATYDSTVSDTSTNAIQNKTIKKYVDDNFAQKDGYYGSLTAGAAENLVGRGSVPAEIAFRTSGGDQDLGTGSALMTKILGRTEAFNQLVQNGNFANGTTDWAGAMTKSVSNNELTAVSVSGSRNSTTNNTAPAINTGHKYYAAYSYISNQALSIQYPGAYQHTEPIAAAWTRVAIIYSPNNTSSALYFYNYSAFAAGDWTLKLRDVFLIDLTLMFGAGNEPATPEAFEALHPLPYYAYNAGVLKNNAATGLETTGFNQWDEVAELGGYSSVDGSKTTTTTTIRSANKIRVTPATNYYILAPSGCWVYCWDADGNFITKVSENNNYIVVNTSGVITTPANCYYIAIQCFTDYGTTYNHDICINLSWSGYRNGEYEPYEKHTLNLPLDAIACHDEDDNAVVVNGLDGVGTAQDELIVENGWGTKINKKQEYLKIDADTDLSLFIMDYASSGAIFLNITNLGKENGAILSSAYVGTTADYIGGQIDKSVRVAPSGSYQNKICIKDTSAITSGMTAAQARTLLTGLEIVYELATPATLTVDEPFAASYYVNDFGTEERLPADTAAAPQAPFCAEIQYAMNATDTLRRLPSQYISDESMTNILTALKTAGIIADFTLTYDSEHQYFTCSITAPSQGE